MCGRATAGIYAVLKALDLDSGKVILPSIVCPSPANAVCYAGFEPVFCDINLTNYTIGIDSIVDVLRKEENIRAIIPVHLYGHAADMVSISKVAQERDIAVIEDAAQALGGGFQGRKLGSWGDASVLSFGHTKILDAGGGGAILIDDEKLANAVSKELQNLPPKPDNLADLFRQYREIYYTLKVIAEENPLVHKLLSHLPEVFKEQYLFQLDGESECAIGEIFGELGERIERRRRNTKRYRALLEHDLISHPTYEEDSVLWRYTFRIPANLQQPVTEYMRSQGHDISNWYPSIHRWHMGSGVYSDQDSLRLDNALRFEREVINLWVDPAAQDIAEIDRIAERFISALDHCYADVGPV